MPGLLDNMSQVPDTPKLLKSGKIAFESRPPRHLSLNDSDTIGLLSFRGACLT